MPSTLFASIPTELAGGRFPAPPLLILVLAGLVVIGAGVFLALRFRQAPTEKR